MSVSSFKSLFSGCAPRRGLALAIAVALVAAACSQPAPSTQRSAEDTLPATAAPSAQPPPEVHSGMDMGEAGQAMDPNAPMAEATVEVSGKFGSGKPVAVTLRLVDMMSGKPMGPEAFDIAHTKKIHVLGVDPSLTDYSHSHPDPSGKPGEWSFSFTPRFNRPYHLWLDVKPVGGEHAYVLLTINDQGAMASAEKTPSLTASVGDISATLAFDAPLVVGETAMGHLLVQRGGKPFAALEPVMGAYSHIVGISEDWTTIAHVHPMGTEPTKPSDRGGPAINFHLELEQAGFLKVFVQIQVDGRDLFLPFGVAVAASASSKAN